MKAPALGVFAAPQWHSLKYSTVYWKTLYACKQLEKLNKYGVSGALCCIYDTYFILSSKISKFRQQRLDSHFETTVFTPPNSSDVVQTVTLSQDSWRQWWQCSLAEVNHQTTGPCFRQSEDLSTHTQTWGPGPDSTVYKYIQWMTQTLHGSLWGGRRWRKVNEECAGTLKPNKRNAACTFQIKLSAVPEF